MKVLVLANFGMGLYKFRKELLEELINKGCEVFTSLPEDEEYIPMLKKIGCKFINTPVSRRGTNPITDLNLLWNYVQIIKEINPDVVLTYTIKPNVYGGLACRINNAPYIANITGLGTAVENGGLLQKVTMFLYKISLKKARCVYFQNEENKVFLTTKEVVKERYEVLPGSGVNLEEYKLLEYPLDNTINFIYISRVMKQKGIEQFLEAATYIKKVYPYTVFHIVGFCEEEYEEKLRELQSKGIIQYHGKQKDVRKFYKLSHCIVHPTYYPEGMSNVLLEGAASGRPIITTNRSGCREIVDDGLNGYLIQPESTDELVKKIEIFLSLDNKAKESMGKAGREKVEKEFNRQFVVKSYLEQIK